MKETNNEISRQEFDDLKRDVKDLQKVFDKITDIAMSTKELAVEMKYMREEQQRQDKRITAIEEKPVKRYDSIVTYIITTIIGAIIGAVVSLIKTK